MAEAAMTTIGLEQFDEMLSNLAAYAQKDVILDSLFDGAEVIADEIRALIPVKSGRSRAAVKVRRGKLRQPGNFSVLVGVGERDFGGETYYYSFVDFGHKQGKRKSQAKDASLTDTRKTVKGEHVVEIASEEKAEAAADRIVKSLVAGLERELGG